jgi:two-component system response regulator YesN
VIDRLLQYIAKNYTNDLGLSELAEMAGLNPAYLSVLFKETVGESYIKYLTDLRIRKAKELLSGGGEDRRCEQSGGVQQHALFYGYFQEA